MLERFYPGEYVDSTYAIDFVISPGYSRHKLNAISSFTP